MSEERQTKEVRVRLDQARPSQESVAYLVVLSVHLQVVLGLSALTVRSVLTERVGLKEGVSEIQNEDVRVVAVVTQPVLVQRISDVREGTVGTRVRIAEEVVLQLAIVGAW